MHYFPRYKPTPGKKDIVWFIHAGHAYLIDFDLSHKDSDDVVDCSCKKCQGHDINRNEAVEKVMKLIQ